MTSRIRYRLYHQRTTYRDTPGHRVLSGHADLGLAPSETVVSFINESHNHPVAVAALLQKDASAIVTLQASGIDQLRKLDGKKYSCFGGKYEMQIVKELVKGDGGEGNIVEDIAPRLSSFVQVLDGNADAAWVFVPWEGVHAQMNEIPLNLFCVGENSSVKYGYSPVLFASQEIMQDSVKAAKLAVLLSATARGYQYAVEHPEESIDMMVLTAKNAALDQLPREYLLCSLKHLIDQKYFFDDDNQWGHMKPQRWHDFVNFLVEKGVLHGRDGQPCSP